MKVREIFETMEYGPAVEGDRVAREWLARHGHTFHHFIGGEWRADPEGERLTILDPASGEELATIAQGDEDDVAAAVAAAQRALPEWRSRRPHERARYLYAIAREIQRHARLFATLETLDNGKPIRESRDIDIPLVIRHFYHHTGWAQLLEREFPDYIPYGVVGQIIPWNFPLLMLAWKVAPALATGNTVVLKPAEYTPLTAFLFAEICAQAGLPAGVVNIVTGDGRTGELIVEHPEIAKVAFTGSTEVGRAIREATAGTGKAITLELGGKSPFIVLEDADLDSVVEGVVDAIWFNQGQVCSAGSRILAQEGIAKELRARLQKRMEKLIVGDPFGRNTDIGAIIAPVQLERIEGLVEEARAEGAEIWQPSWSRPEEGWFYPPTLCTGVGPAARIAQVEVFGPVVVMMTFRTPAEAVELANNTPYGLAASIWTQDIDRALDLAKGVRAGTVWVNSTNLFDAAAGFGGFRESGFGREGGREGLYEYLRPRWEVEPERKDRLYDRAHDTKTWDGLPAQVETRTAEGAPQPPIDRTPKFYIGGRQVRPDSGYSTPVLDHEGRVIGEVGIGGAKDIRNAVEAARKAQGWTTTTAHHRAQVLYYLAENLAARAPDFANQIAISMGKSHEEAEREVELSVERIFSYAAWADKWEGHTHSTPSRNLTVALPEPLGVVGVITPPEEPLLALVSTVLPLIALGNRTVVVPSERAPLVATDLYQVLDTSDLPGGVVNILLGRPEELAAPLAAHDGVDAVWYFGSREGSTLVEKLSAGNLKRTWVDYGIERDWTDAQQGEGPEFLRRATEIKNIWVPYGA